MDAWQVPAKASAPHDRASAPPGPWSVVELDLRAAPVELGGSGDLMVDWQLSGADQPGASGGAADLDVRRREATAHSFARSLRQLVAATEAGEVAVASHQERRLLARVQNALSAFEIGRQVAEP